MTADTKQGMNRRGFLAAGAATAGLVTGFPAIVRAQSKQIVTTLYGGNFEAGLRKYILEPFTAKTGTEFVLKYGNVEEWLNSTIISRDDPEIDLPLLSLPVASRAVKIPGLFMDLTPKEVPSLADIRPIFKDPYAGKGVGMNYVEYGILYRDDMVEKPIKSWADLWDPSLEKKIILPGPAAGAMYEVVMMAARVAGAPDDWRAGVDKLKELKPNIVRWYNTVNDVAGLFQRKEAGVVAGFTNFRSYQLLDGGIPGDFVSPAEGSPIGVLSWHVPQKVRNPDLVLEFLNFALDAQQQNGFANFVPSGVTSSKVVYDEKIAGRIAPQENLVRLDWTALQKDFTAITEAMQREVITG